MIWFHVVSTLFSPRRPSFSPWGSFALQGCRTIVGRPSVLHYRIQPPCLLCANSGTRDTRINIPGLQFLGDRIQVDVEVVRHKSADLGVFSIAYQVKRVVRVGDVDVDVDGCIKPLVSDEQERSSFNKTTGNRRQSGKVKEGKGKVGGRRGAS